ncbi:TniQ family protein [Shimia sediminis]|uniref:TniQ family protein n=1 Tax=Shimia sediminis TaxID=2497945 RepID=UPI000F8CE5AE|nr:TniQ family protein [Shimia sediminis]
MNSKLPVTLPSAPDELLSSWISRHAAFYGVTPQTMFTHCLPEAASLRSVDLCLTIDQSRRIADTFSTESRTVRAMTFEKATKPMQRFIAKAPIQSCARCTASTHGPVSIRRSQLQGWRITCPICGGWLQSEIVTDHIEALAPYRDTALQGEKLLHDEAERGRQTWGSPLALARVLLMRWIPWPLLGENDLWRFRVLGVLVPEFDAILARLTSFHHSPKHPILPLHIRPALLAGVAILERTGPEMLKMLEGHTFGVNRDKFIQTTDHLVSPAVEWGPPRQMQLI